MSVIVHNGLRNTRPITQSLYREAVCETVRALQGKSSDRDFADETGLAASTVANARNKNNDLSAVNLLKIIKARGPAALDTVLALVDARAVDREAVAVDVSKIPCDVAKVLPLLIELFADGACCDSDVRTLDNAGAIDCITRVADMLRNRRDEVRTGVVSFPANGRTA